MEATQLQIFTMISTVVAIATLVVLIVLRGILQKLNELSEKRGMVLHQAQTTPIAPAAAPVLSQQTAVPVPAPVAAPVPTAAAAQGVIGEILVVIAAAAYTLYNVPVSAIQSVTLIEPAPLAVAAAPAPAPRIRSTWTIAGLLENTHPF